MAENEDKDSKTEDPTSKRLEKAREEGDIADSQEIKTFAILVAGLVIVGVVSPMFISRLGAILTGLLERVHVLPTDPEGLRSLFVGLLGEVGALMAIPFGLLIMAALIGSVGQNGFLYTPKKLAPKLSAIDPIKNVNKVISKQKLIDALKQIVKIAIVVAAAAFFVVPFIPHPDALVDMPVSMVLADIRWLLVLLLVAVILAFLFVSLGDLVWSRYHHRTKLKMTKQEVKDESKQSEGDPMVKGRIRSMRMQRSRERMMSAVPTASVVVTNPTHFAVALQYDMGSMAAPKLVAKGVDFLAARIREVAKENNVPIVENPPLARALYAAVELDEEIPQDHYKAVAEVIGYVMRLNGADKTKPKT